MYEGKSIGNLLYFVAITSANHFQQLLDIGEVQTGGRLIENIDGLAGGLLGKLRSQLHPLGLAAGQLRGGLAQFHIAQAHIL